MLDLAGECGFGRECVGISRDGTYPDYQWYDDEYERIDGNGEIWTPPNSYHKHPCVAVLGRGESSEEELYDWLKWFDDNNFTVESSQAPIDKLQKMHFIELMMGKHTNVRMVRKA
jgi:hypothetical protein